jgi:prevent-host-death family protein
VTRRWSFQEAEDHFSELVDEAALQGPQLITQQGVETAVVLAYDDYLKLTAGRKSLLEFFRESPMVGTELDLARDRSGLRDEPSL